MNETEFEDFVIYHQKVVKLTQKLIKIYRPVIFVEYICVAINLGFTCVQIIMVNDILQILTAILHSFTVMSDAFIYAYGAQKILDSSSEVFDYFEKIDKRYLLIMMISHKKLTFEAKFFDSSLSTLSIMLSRAVSFITFLKTFV